LSSFYTDSIVNILVGTTVTAGLWFVTYWGKYVL